MICPLAKLKINEIVGDDAVNLGHPDVVDRVFHDVLVGRPLRIRGEDVPTDASNASKDLACDQKGIQHGDTAIQEFIVTPNQVILVTAEGVSSEVIDRVVVDAHDVF